jgi:hypothetical protein
MTPILQQNGQLEFEGVLFNVQASSEKHPAILRVVRAKPELISERGFKVETWSQQAKVAAAIGKLLKDHEHLNIHQRRFFIEGIDYSIPKEKGRTPAYDADWHSHFDEGKHYTAIATPFGNIDRGPTWHLDTLLGFQYFLETYKDYIYRSDISEHVFKRDLYQTINTDLDNEDILNIFHFRDWIESMTAWAGDHDDAEVNLVTQKVISWLEQFEQNMLEQGAIPFTQWSKMQSPTAVFLPIDDIHRADFDPKTNSHQTKVGRNNLGTWTY